MGRRPTPGKDEDEQVLTPGGPRRRSLVTKVGKGEIVRFDEDGKGHVVKRGEPEGE